MWRLLEGDWDRPPAAAAALGRYMVHRGGGGQWSLPSYGTQYSVLREGAYISTFTLKNLFLRTRYLFSGTFSEYWVGVNMVTLTNSGFSFWRHCFLLGMPELVTSCSSGQSLPPSSDTRLVQSVIILLQAPTLSLSPHPRSRPSPPGHWCWGQTGRTRPIPISCHLHSSLEIASLNQNPSP